MKEFKDKIHELLESVDHHSWKLGFEYLKSYAKPIEVYIALVRGILHKMSSYVFYSNDRETEFFNSFTAEERFVIVRHVLRAVVAVPEVDEEDPLIKIQNALDIRRLIPPHKVEVDKVPVSILIEYYKKIGQRAFFSINGVDVRRKLEMLVYYLKITQGTVYQKYYVLRESLKQIQRIERPGSYFTHPFVSKKLLELFPREFRLKMYEFTISKYKEDLKYMTVDVFLFARFASAAGYENEAKLIIQASQYILKRKDRLELLSRIQELCLTINEKVRDEEKSSKRKKGQRFMDWYYQNMRKDIDISYLFDGFYPDGFPTATKTVKGYCYR
jgi:hypothetical protein